MIPPRFPLSALKLTIQLFSKHMQYTEKHEILMTPQHSLLASSQFLFSTKNSNLSPMWSICGVLERGKEF